MPCVTVGADVRFVTYGLLEKAGEWFVSMDSRFGHRCWWMMIRNKFFGQHLLDINPRVSGQVILDELVSNSVTQYGSKIIVFCDDDNVLTAGLSMGARENGDWGVRDNPLRWYLRQCVLARGAGEPVCDYDPEEPGDVVSRS
jgi:hypothetical protein